jgi:Domain of unknown function (DUF4190)
MTERLCPGCGWLTQQWLDEPAPAAAHAAEVPGQVDRTTAAGVSPLVPMMATSNSMRPQTVVAAPINRLARASLTVSLAGLLLPFAFPAGAIIGHVARAQIGRSNERGDGLAFVGIVIGWFGTVLTISLVGWLLGTAEQ